MSIKMDNFKRTEGVLYNYYTLQAEIDIIDIDIEDLRDEYEGPSSIGYEERTGSTNKITDSVANEVINRERTIMQLERTKRQKARLLKRINIALDNLDKNERDFVEYRYLNKNKCSWIEVGRKLGLDYMHCCNVIRPQIINKLSCLIYGNL